MLWLLLHSACTASSLFSPPSLGEDTDRTAETNYPKGYSVPYDLMLSNKNSGKRGAGRGGDTFMVMAHAFPSNHYMRWGTTCPKVSGRCLTIGSSEWISLFAFLDTQLLLSLLKCHYLDPPVFLLSFYFLPIPQEKGVSKRLGGCLAAGQGQLIINNWFLERNGEVNSSDILFFCNLSKKRQIAPPYSRD